MKDKYGRPADPAEWDILGERAGARRFPRVPKREELAEDDLTAWDDFQIRFERVREEAHFQKYRHRMAGGFFGLMCNPKLASQLAANGRPAMAQQGMPNSFTAVDHELIDLVFAFDSGHWGLVANHAAYAVASGLSTSMIRALRDGREEELSPRDRRTVAFIRAARDGTITDQLWTEMVEQIGSERGLVAFLYLTLHLLMHQRMIQAFDEVQITPEELEDQLGMLERGEHPLPKVKHGGPPELLPTPAHPYLGGG